MLPEAGPGCPGFCGSAEAEGRWIGIFSKWRDLMGRGAGGMAQPCLQSLLCRACSDSAAPWHHCSCSPAPKKWFNSQLDELGLD